MKFLIETYRQNDHFICMKTTLNIDENLLAEAMRCTQIKEKTAAIHLGLQALIKQAAALRLSRMGGKMPNLKIPTRKRSTARHSTK
jgi:Arc/MetJ family transcription regulator